jgi:hypothetical protein
MALFLTGNEAVWIGCTTTRPLEHAGASELMGTPQHDSPSNSATGCGDPLACVRPGDTTYKGTFHMRYTACFFAGIFLANAVPHFVHGISGDRFPTPFAHPPGKGLSSPTLNIAWASLNLAGGYALLRAGKLLPTSDSGLVPLFAGVAAIGAILSVQFTKKQAG